MLTVILLIAARTSVRAAELLLSNGDFETVKDAKPADWGLGEGATWESEGANHFLRLTSPRPEANVNVYRAVSIPPDVKAVELSYKVRYEGVKRGSKAWFDARIMMNWKDAQQNAIQPGPKHPNFTGTSKGWVERSQQIRVPEGATTLEMIFALFQAQSGQVDFDDVRLTPIPVSVIDQAEAAAKAKDAARIAALPRPKPQVPVPPADKLPKMLKVAGNQLLDADGKPVWLQGVAVPSLEYSAGGEKVLESIRVAIDGWKADVIRLPIRENFWAGAGPYQNDGGMKYRQLIEDAVNLCAGKGAYIVLDLHDFRAPREKHVAFWSAVASKYANHPAVLFELFNEPHGISWDVWRDGGKVFDKKKADDKLAENQQNMLAFESVGMQKLLDAVRATGAKNVVIAGGLDWGYDLAGVTTGGFDLKDAAGNGVVYSSHVYPWKSDWQHKFLDAAAKHPVFIGECGAEEKYPEWVPPQHREDGRVWSPDMIGTIQAHKLHWTAWAFHPKVSPALLNDWDYTPSPQWGAYVKRALTGETFEVKKLR